MTNYSQMSDIEIDTAVSNLCSPEFHRNYCNNPADAWPIIVENKISMDFVKSDDSWSVHSGGEISSGSWDWDSYPVHYEDHENPLRAAMIVFLMMKDAEHDNPTA